MELKHSPLLLLLLLLLLLVSSMAIAVESRESRRGGGGGGGRSSSSSAAAAAAERLRFRRSGEFKVLQVADMHYADGRTTECLDVFPSQMATCSDLNTTAFIFRVIRAENPDLVVFTGSDLLLLP